MTDAASWFDTARFGMFVHWSFISMRGRELSWPLVGGIPALPYAGGLPVDEYYDGALEFAPERDGPAGWADLARKAGMRYGVLTTKHHDGFALFHTRHGDFSIEQAKYRGDLVSEFTDAFRAAGLRVGLYFSLSDWHHPDYPAFREDMKPYLGPGYPRPEPAAWERYLTVLFGQVRELLANYGPIDVIWFDGGWERTAAEWRAPELESMIRGLQPDILINDRLPGCGDFDTPEQLVPAEPPPRRWETCMTMNRTWGYCPADTEYSSARDIVHTLCETAGKGGNLLLNVGPRPDGRIPTEQVERLEAVGDWMSAHGRAVHDTQTGLEPWQFYGPTTRRGDSVFLHLLMRPYDAVCVRGVRVRRVRAVREVRSRRELAWTTRLAALDELTGGDAVGELRIAVPDELVDDLATVLEVVFEPGIGQ